MEFCDEFWLLKLGIFVRVTDVAGSRFSDEFGRFLVLCSMNFGAPSADELQMLFIVSWFGLRVCWRMQNLCLY
ncbi:hypothetical protein MtrunA17_Chr7g0219821 [Medicago truncatula]|uniref:Uncharacterized protein n=1 Tax=Medicago truncatula TaxID=3880 RepID=A0A396GVC0_MEDTR|nr:hypothetical protein MtrunA17_Chr7g0219821 [Medicago truncatula]